MKIKKKPLLAIVLLVMVAVIGFTIAYFTSSASFVNEFTTGTYKVTTTEVFESPDNWKPGEEIPKTITTTNEGTIPAAVRVSYTEQWLDGDTDITSSIDEGTAIINLDNTNDWTKEGNYYYYNYILEPNETTSSFIKSVTLNPELGDDDDTECTRSQDGLSVTCEGTNPALGAKYILTLTKETVQADKYQDLWNTNVEITEKQQIIILPVGKDKENLESGDEICINGVTTECFYFVKYDGTNNEDLVLISKYNLNVGENSKGTATNLQDSDVKGWLNEGTKYGNVPFSETRYWHEGTTLKPKYGENYPASIVDFDYSDASGDNHSIAYYIKEYKEKLEEYGATIKEARLLTYDEAYNAIGGCTLGYNCPSSVDYIAETSYWLATAYDSDRIHVIYALNSLARSDYFTSTYFGVRPVIVISKSNI